MLKKIKITQKQANNISNLCDKVDWKRITKKYNVVDLIPAQLYKIAWFYGFERGYRFKKKI